MNKNVLLVAFDGADKELIEEFGCDNLNQEEFGLIDNQEGISSVKTSELFASLITGETYENHGVKGISKTPPKWKENLLDFIVPDLLHDNVRGFHRIKSTLKAAIGADKKIRYRKEDLEVDSLFEEINDSNPISVPSYNPSWAWMLVLAKPLHYGGGKKGAEEFCEIDHTWRKEKMNEDLSYDFPYSFLMAHFHKIDLWQHLYGYPSYDEKKLEEVYDEIDEYALEIKERALEVGYDYIIFMSDHGLPTENEHNENAFYSCNKELFGDKTPHITDFHDKILELTGNKHKIE